jgi:hypothetical protein
MKSQYVRYQPKGRKLGPWHEEYNRDTWGRITTGCGYTLPIRIADLNFFSRSTTPPKGEPVCQKCVKAKAGRG